MCAYKIYSMCSIVMISPKILTIKILCQICTVQIIAYKDKIE